MSNIKQTYTIEQIKYYLEGNKFVDLHNHNPDCQLINNIIDSIIRELDDEEDGIEAVIKRRNK